MKLFRKAGEKLNIKPHNIERSLRTIIEIKEREIKYFFELNCDINCGILIEAVHREVKRRENGDKRKMFMCEM